MRTSWWYALLYYIKKAYYIPLFCASQLKWFSEEDVSVLHVRCFSITCLTSLRKLYKSIYLTNLFKLNYFYITFCSFFMYKMTNKPALHITQTFSVKEFSYICLTRIVMKTGIWVKHSITELIGKKQYMYPHEACIIILYQNHNSHFMIWYYTRDM